MPGVRDGRAATVADRDLDGARADRPGDLEPLAGQRVRVQDRVAQQFADDESGIGDRVIEYPCRPQVLGERLAREGYARRGTRQVDDARRPHLPDRPPRQSRRAACRRRRVPMPELTAPETGGKRGDDHSGPPIAAARVTADSALPSQQGIADR